MAEAERVIAVELEREVDGRWIADVPALPGIMAYGADLPEAISKVVSLVVTYFLDQHEAVSDLQFVLRDAA